MFQYILMFPFHYVCRLYPTRTPVCVCFVIFLQNLYPGFRNILRYTSLAQGTSSETHFCFIRDCPLAYTIAETFRLSFSEICAK
jgi:hypothetical protein